jgi:hypothetical protein
LPGLGWGVQAQLLDVVELTDAVVLVVAAQHTTQMHCDSMN